MSGMNTSISPLLQRVKPLLGSLAGKAKTLLGKAQPLLGKAQPLLGKAKSLLGKVMAQILTLLVKTAKHPQIKETGETCSDLWSDLKKLKHHPKVLTWREHMAQRIGQLAEEAAGRELQASLASRMNEEGVS